MRFLVTSWRRLFGESKRDLIGVHRGPLSWTDICGNEGTTYGTFPVYEIWNSKRPAARRAILRWHGMEHEIDRALYLASGRVSFSG
jgi:hypothetical protein